MIYRQYYLFLRQLGSMPLAHIFFLAVLTITYGVQAFTMNYYVDSEVVINIPETTYNWYEIGRYGLVFTKWLLGTTWYNPFYTGLLFLLFLWLAASCFYYIGSRILPRTPKPMIAIFSMIVLTYPSFTEQYYFHYQSAEIAFGILLSFLCMGMFYLFVQHKQNLWLMLALPILVLVFAIYQSFVPFVLCSYLFIFVIVMYRSRKELKFPPKGIATIWGAILQFVLSFACSQLIHSLFFDSEDYLSNQIIWTVEGSLLDKIRVVASVCIRMFLGEGIFYTSLLLLASILILIFWIRRPFVSKLSSVFSFLGLLGILLTPFALSLILGSNVAIRSQFTLGYAAVCLLLIAYEFGFADLTFVKLSVRRLWNTSLIVVSGTLLLLQLKDINTIYSINQEVRDYDYAMSTHILADLYDSYAVKDQAPITFWGHHQAPTSQEEIVANNPSYLFLSVYNLEYDMEPYNFFSSNRILGYFESLGHTFTYPTSSSRTLSEYIIRVDNPPTFPLDGYVHLLQEAVTVNLGDGISYDMNSN